MYSVLLFGIMTKTPSIIQIYKSHKRRYTKMYLESPYFPNKRVDDLRVSVRPSTVVRRGEPEPSGLQCGEGPTDRRLQGGL